MKSENTNALILGTIIFLAVSRLLPHPNNFTPLGGIAILGATYINPRFMKYVVPIVAFYLSDLLVSNLIYSSFYSDTSFVSLCNHILWNYGTLLLILSI